MKGQFPLRIVSRDEGDIFVTEISDELKKRGKPLVYFKCWDIYGDTVLSRKATSALNRHLRKTGGRIGGYIVERDLVNCTRHGVRWKAVAERATV